MNLQPTRPAEDISQMQADYETLNRAALDELESAVGSETVPELLRAFGDDLIRLRRAAAAAMAEDNQAGFAATMHSLRGSCSYFGAARLGAIATHYQLAARAGHVDLQQAWAVLEPALAATIADYANVEKRYDA